MSFELSRRQNADLYGPTTGDAVRLGDTDLFAEIERDLTHHGEEAVFGGGKVIRDGMGHNGRAVRADGVVDTVITNVVVIDHTGIYKADIGIVDGAISAIGAAGNPDITDEQLAFAREQLKAYGIVDSGDALEKGIGVMTKEHIDSFFNDMVKAGAISSDLDYSSAYSLDFVGKGVGLDLKK